MTLTDWLVYVTAVLVLTLTPGPSVLMTVSVSVNLGWRRAMLAALGSTTAIVGIMTLSALGLGAALAASEHLFMLLKWAGAAYLAYLGITALLSPAEDIQVNRNSTPPADGWRLVSKGFLVGASNPKALLFFGALFPQFMHPAQPQLPQFLILGATFLFFELFWLTLYAVFAARAARWLQQPHRARTFNRATGAVFLLAAGLLANSKRHAVT